MNRPTNVNESLGCTDRDDPPTLPTTSSTYGINRTDNTSTPIPSSSNNIWNLSLLAESPYNIFVDDIDLRRNNPNNEADNERNIRICWNSYRNLWTQSDEHDILDMSPTRRNNNSVSANSSVLDSFPHLGSQLEMEQVTARPRLYPSSDAADSSEAHSMGMIRPRSATLRIERELRVLQQTYPNNNPRVAGSRVCYSTTAADAENKNNDVCYVADNEPSRHHSSKESATKYPSHICSICLESYLDQKPTTTECGHVFCEECIKQAVRFTQKCPLCKLKVTPQNLFRLHF